MKANSSECGRSISTK